MSIDLTPGFNLHSYAGGGIPFVSAGNGTSGRPTGTGTDAGDAAANAYARNLLINQPQYGSGATPQDASQPGGYDSNPYGGYGSAAAQQVAAQEGQTKADNVAYLNDQETQLRDLLGRTDTNLNQGVQRINEDYQGNVNQQNSQHDQANQGYTENRVATTKDKIGGYDKINKGANNGYRSLAQIIGRNAGTGSSAFQDLLPDVIGKDTSAKRGDVNATYASNLGNIDTAQKKTDISFQSILDDLARQRQSAEGSFRGTVEGQRQDINSKLGANAGARATAQGGGYQAVHDAQGQYQDAINNSKNAVENFFNTYNPGIKAGQATVAAADTSAYNVDRSNVNAGQNGGNSTNPYADIIRKKLQEQTAI